MKLFFGIYLLKPVFHNCFSLPPPPPLPESEQKSTEEKEAEKKKEHDMETRKKNEYAKKECEALEELMTLQKTVSLSPIGRDRLFRRYYYFSALNGVFVEDHELHVPAAMLKPGLASADAGSKVSVCILEFFIIVLNSSSTN